MSTRKYVKMIKMFSHRDACAVRVFDGAGQGEHVGWCKDGVFHRRGAPFAALMPDGWTQRNGVTLENRRTVVDAMRSLRERGYGIRLP